MGVILVFDLTEEQSFENVRNWLRQIKMHAGENVCKILVGNKSDLESERKVNQNEVKQLAESNNIAFIETSALNSTNIEKAFQILIRCSYLWFQEIAVKYIKEKVVKKNDKKLKGEVIEISKKP